MASQAAVANSASFQQDSALVARYAADRRSRGYSVSSQASEASISISEEETAYSSVCGSGVATPIPRNGQTTTELPSSKSKKYLHHDDVPAFTENSPLLPRPRSTERNGHARPGEDELEEGEWTWWDELKTLSSYVLPVYGYVLSPFAPSSQFVANNILTVCDKGPTS